MSSELDENKFCIYVPCYNGGRFIAHTVSRIPWTLLPAGADYSLLFVDNASTDNSWEEIEKLRANFKNADAIRHPTNRGYGGTVKSAFDYCIGRGIGQIAVVHADGQYAPEELPQMIAALRANPKTALHFGSRLTGKPLDGRMPFYRFAANHFLSWIQNVVLGTKLSEFQSGYRLYRLALVDGVPWRNGNDGFVFDNEIIFLLRQHGLGISESTIPTFYGDEISYVPKIGTPLAILKNSWRYALAEKGGRKDPLYNA